MVGRDVLDSLVGVYGVGNMVDFVVMLGEIVNYWSIFRKGEKRLYFFLKNWYG